MKVPRKRFEMILELRANTIRKWFKHEAKAVRVQFLGVPHSVLVGMFCRFGMYYVQVQFCTLLKLMLAFLVLPFCRVRFLWSIASD